MPLVVVDRMLRRKPRAIGKFYEKRTKKYAKETRATLVKGTPKSGQPAYGSNAEVRTGCLWKKRRGKDSLPTEVTPR